MNPSKHILLVEDDKHDQYFFVKAISKIDNAFLQSIAEDGVAALESLENSTELPDLIFMDINMPRMNGLECLAAIVNSDRFKQIPVVMLSTSTEEVELTRALGAKGFIKKPWNGDKLQEKMEQMINLDFAQYSYVANQTFASALSDFSVS